MRLCPPKNIFHQAQLRLLLDQQKLCDQSLSFIGVYSRNVKNELDWLVCYIVSFLATCFTSSQRKTEYDTIAT